MQGHRRESNMEMHCTGKRLKKQLEKHKYASFVKNWLFTHFIGVDMKYAEHGHH